jgi:UPF0271 protein
MTLDLNCDLGESYGDTIIGNDTAIMPHISSANIACGFHGGDALTIAKTIQLALKYNVQIGAHPGYPDIEGFGRRAMKLGRDELRASLLYQVGALKSMTEAMGGRLRHVKLHGALYNEAAVKKETAQVAVEAIEAIDKSLIIVGIANSEIIKAALRKGLSIACEVFADRAYNNDGTLADRNIKGAVIHDATAMVRRVMQMITEKKVETISGKLITVQADTVCIHGDNPSAPEFVKLLEEALKAGNIPIQAPHLK